jgi:CRP/FNR family transcriptional regulator, polysaccharide utilization system transcription regulator
MSERSEQSATGEGTDQVRSWADVFRVRERRLALEPGVQLYEQGSPADGVYLIHKGSIELRLSTRSQLPVVLGQALEGELLGLGAVLMQRAHDETAVAMTPAVVGFLSLDDFMRLFVENREFRFEVLQRMSAGLELANQQIVVQRRTG